MYYKVVVSGRGYFCVLDEGAGMMVFVSKRSVDIEWRDIYLNAGKFFVMTKKTYLKGNIIFIIAFALTSQIILNK